MQVVLAEPRGFCAGVQRAVEIVEAAVAKFGAPIYVRHEIVHNRHVVERLRAKGVIFIDELDEAPKGAVTIFSAHGVSQAVEDDAAARGLDSIDATCPLVLRVHLEGQRYQKRGYEVVLIGHKGHPEVEGTMGRLAPPVHLVGSVADVAGLTVSDSEKVAYVTQTTLSVDDTSSIIAALRARFPSLIGPGTDEICYATQNRQAVVRDLARAVELVLVVGAPNSSNSNRLRELAEEAGVPAYLIEEAADLKPEWLAGKSRVGVTAGASAPEDLVQEVVMALRPDTVSHLGNVREDLQFKLPPQLL